jgi:signal transduction histidine kinase
MRLANLTTLFKRRVSRCTDICREHEHRFASDVAHELRTPLAAQIVLAQTALRQVDPKQHEDALHLMLDEARHMERLIDRLLALTRIATEPNAFACEAVDVPSAVAHTTGTLRVLAEDKRQTLTVDCAPGLHALGETTMLRQALMNLAHNAIEHCPRGANIVLRCQRIGEHAVIDVDDDGPGVPAKARPHLFNRFYRGAPTANTARGGLGLGLSIVKALMQAQGGAVTLEPKIGSGACFRLWLPLHRHDAMTTPRRDLSIQHA